MNVESSNLVSNGRPVKGFEQDGNFVGCEPMGNYLLYTYFQASPMTNKFEIINKDDFWLELVSVTAGDSMALNQLNCYSIVNNDPNFILWGTNFQGEPNGQAYLPYSFKAGILVPPKARLYFNLNNSPSFFQVVFKPIVPTLAGIVSHGN